MTKENYDWWGGRQRVLGGLRYVTKDDGALSVLMLRMKHGVRRMLKLSVGLLDTVELSTQYCMTRKILQFHCTYIYTHYIFTQW